MKKTIRYSLPLMIFLAPLGTIVATVTWTQAPAFGQESVHTEKSYVQDNQPDEPRFTPLTRPAMKQYIEDLKNRTPRIPLPEMSDEEKKREIESPRTFGYESRLRTHYVGENAGSGYGGFWGSASNNPNASGNRPNAVQDPNLTLDYAFKVRLFWIAARANNCQYCLGHQESKLLAAGMTEDAIAALDSDWDAFAPNEQAAFALAKRMTNEPQMLCDADIEACRKFYSDLQIIEMIGSIAGSNAINRWKEGAGIPQSSGGGNFGRSSETANASHSYLTPTSDKFFAKKTIVAVPKLVLDPKVQDKAIAATRCNRPALEVGAELQKAISSVQSRKPRLPLLSEEKTKEVLGDLAPESNVPQWMRLMAHYPVAGKRFVAAVLASQQLDELNPKLQAEMDWVIARQDRAWYAVTLAKNDLSKFGVGAAEIEALDGDVSVQSNSTVLTPKERALLTVAKNLAASPIVLTDAQVTKAVEIAGPKAVAQAISYTTYRAAFNRITEAAGLSTSLK